MNKKIHAKFPLCRKKSQFCLENFFCKISFILVKSISWGLFLFAQFCKYHQTCHIISNLDHVKRFLLQILFIVVFCKKKKHFFKIHSVQNIQNDELQKKTIK